MKRSKSVQEIKVEIFREMSVEKKLTLVLKINDKILKIARKKIKSRYPNLDPISFSKELYKHLSLKRKFYENLFDQFLREEMKKYQNEPKLHQRLSRTNLGCW